MRGPKGTFTLNSVYWMHLNKLPFLNDRNTVAYNMVYNIQKLNYGVHDIL